MKFLKDNGYHPLTMDQLYDYVVNGAAVPEKPVVLTFDDGYADTYSIVYPLMKEYGFLLLLYLLIQARCRNAAYMGTAKRNERQWYNYF